MSAVEWWTLPDGTLVRDAKGELRMVRRYQRNPETVRGVDYEAYEDIYLDHWSDEYAPCHATGGYHAERENAAMDPNEQAPVTVVGRWVGGHLEVTP